MRGRMLFEIQPSPAQKRVGATGVKKSPTARAALGHHVGVGGGAFRGRANNMRINLVLFADRENFLSQRVIADKAGAEELKRSAGTGQVHKHVERSAAGAFGLRKILSPIARAGDRHR